MGMMDHADSQDEIGWKWLGQLLKHIEFYKFDTTLEQYGAVGSNGFEWRNSLNVWEAHIWHLARCSLLGDVVSWLGPAPVPSRAGRGARLPGLLPGR